MTDDIDLTDDKLLTVPGENIRPGRLSEFFTRRAGIHDEARAEHAKNPHAATAQEKADTDRQSEELEKLKHDIQQHRAQTGSSTDVKHEQEVAGDYEKRFQQATEARRAEIEAKPDSAADAYSADYMADFGRTTSYAKLQDGEGKTLAANFTPAAQGIETPANRKPDQAPAMAASPAGPQV